MIDEVPVALPESVNRSRPWLMTVGPVYVLVAAVGPNAVATPTPFGTPLGLQFAPLFQVCVPEVGTNVDWARAVPAARNTTASTPASRGVMGGRPGFVAAATR